MTLTAWFWAIAFFVVLAGYVATKSNRLDRPPASTLPARLSMRSSCGARR